MKKSNGQFKSVGIFSSLLFLINSKFTIEHFIPTDDECFVADLCNHTWILECGKESIGSVIKIFSDDCDRHEYNCDNNKDFVKTDLSECFKTTISTATQTTIPTTKEPTTTTITLNTTTTPITTTTTTPMTTTITSTTTTTPTITTTTMPTPTTTLTTATKPTTTVTIPITTIKPATITTTTTTTSKPLTTTHVTASFATPTIVHHRCTRTDRSSSSPIVPSNAVIESSTPTTTLTPITTDKIATTKTAIDPTTVPTTISTTVSTTAYTTLPIIANTRVPNSLSAAVPTTIATELISTKPTIVSRDSTNLETKFDDINQNTISHNTDDIATKANAKVPCVINGCDLPFSWETTAKGEIRDIFQILRDRYGDKMKLLKATTHWPKMNGWRKNYRNDFVFGRHIDSHINNQVK